jgi:hypothetical protein
MLRTFSDNPTCRHIIFGGCHDAGYLLNLEQFKHNEQKAARISLLETTPAYRGFADLALFKRARFDSVFKSEPLPDSAGSNFTATSNTFVPNTFVPSTFVQQSTQVPNPGILRTTTNQSPRPSVASPSPSTPPSSAATVPPTEANGDSWGMLSRLLNSSSLIIICDVAVPDGNPEYCLELANRYQLPSAKPVAQRTAASPSRQALRLTRRKSTLITTKTK